MDRRRGLLVRVGAEDQDELLGDDRALSRWLERGVAAARAVRQER